MTAPSRDERPGAPEERTIVTFTDAEPSGLADLVGRLIEANLAAHPERKRLLRPATIELRATDAGVAASVALAPGSVTLRRAGAGGRPDLVVAASSNDLLEIAAAPLRFGLPDPFSARGRMVLVALARRRIEVVGLLRHPIVLARFAKLLSVADERGG